MAGSNCRLKNVSNTMSAGGSGSANSSRNSINVRLRGLHCLQRIKDVSKEIFRNLQNVSKTGRDEPGGLEKAENLRTQRENCIQLLCSFQSELHEAVGALNKAIECKEEMNSMKKKIENHEFALRKFGNDLKSAEQILSDVLRRTAHEGNCSTSVEPVEFDIDELIRYSHVISYSTSAQEGWEPNTVLTGALPPAPHSEMMARSRLFSFEQSAVRPSRLLELDAGVCEWADAHEVNSGMDGAAGVSNQGVCVSQPGKVELGKRGSIDREGFEGEGFEGSVKDVEVDMYKVWSLPLQNVSDSLSQAAEPHEDTTQRRQKRQAVVPPPNASPLEHKGVGGDAKMRDDKDENVVSNLRQDTSIEIPKRPSWWRPGVPISVDTAVGTPDH